jgi:hypothetical protein
MTVGGWVDVSSGAGGTVLLLSVPMPDNPASGPDTVTDPTYDKDEDHDPSAWGAP